MVQTNDGGYIVETSDTRVGRARYCVRAIHDQPLVLEPQPELLLFQPALPQPPVLLLLLSLLSAFQPPPVAPSLWTGSPHPSSSCTMSSVLMGGAGISIGCDASKRVHSACVFQRGFPGCSGGGMSIIQYAEEKE